MHLLHKRRNVTKKKLKYSKRLVKHFQTVYYQKFNERISKEKAMLELDFLATMVKLLLEEKLINKEIKNGN